MIIHIMLKVDEILKTQQDTTRHSIMHLNFKDNYKNTSAGIWLTKGNSMYLLAESDWSRTWPRLPTRKEARLEDRSGLLPFWWFFLIWEMSYFFCLDFNIYEIWYSSYRITWCSWWLTNGPRTILSSWICIFALHLSATVPFIRSDRICC